MFNRRVVGCAMAGHLRTPLVVDAPEMAVAHRGPEAVIRHSDLGCQHTSPAFGARCRERGIARSMIQWIKLRPDAPGTHTKS